MRTLAPPLTAFVVLVALWPAVCMSGEDEPTSCQSLVLLPLIGEDWAMIIALGAAVMAFLAVRWLARRGQPEHS